MYKVYLLKHGILKKMRFAGVEMLKYIAWGLKWYNGKYGKRGASIVVWSREDSVVCIQCKK